MNLDIDNTKCNKVSLIELFIQVLKYPLQYIRVISNINSSIGHDGYLNRLKPN